jgi:hypothetical protein
VGTRYAVIFVVLIALALTSSSVMAQPRLYALDSSRALSTLDMNTGAKTPVCTVSSNAGTTGGLAYDRINDIMYLTSTSNDSLFRLNTTTCAATLIGPYGNPSLVMHGLEYDISTGGLYGGSDGNLYEINKLTGAASLIGASGLTSFLNLGYNSNTDVMYATSSSTDSSYTINRNTGAVTLLGPLLTSTNPHGLAYDWNNDIMFMVDSSTDNLNRLDMVNGDAEVIGSTGTGNLLGLAYVPEPGTLALLAMGSLSLLRRRR